jgi:hypothetical protein
MIAMHLLHRLAIRPNLELKTWLKQLLGHRPLVIVLLGLRDNLDLRLCHNFVIAEV